MVLNARSVPSAVPEEPGAAWPGPNAALAVLTAARLGRDVAPPERSAEPAGQCAGQTVLNVARSGRHAVPAAVRYASLGLRGARCPVQNALPSVPSASLKDVMALRGVRRRQVPPVVQHRYRWPAWTGPRCHCVRENESRDPRHCYARFAVPSRACGARSYCPHCRDAGLPHRPVLYGLPPVAHPLRTQRHRGCGSEQAGCRGCGALLTRQCHRDSSSGPPAGSLRRFVVSRGDRDRWRSRRTNCSSDGCCNSVNAPRNGRAGHRHSGGAASSCRSGNGLPGGCSRSCRNSC